MRIGRPRRATAIRRALSTPRRPTDRVGGVTASQRSPSATGARLFTKLGELLRRDYDRTRDAAATRARVLLVYADADALLPASELAWYALFGGGQHDAGLDGSSRSTAQLAIVPGTTHYNIIGSPLLAPILAGFLATP